MDNVSNNRGTYELFFNFKQSFQRKVILEIYLLAIGRVQGPSCTSLI